MEVHRGSPPTRPYLKQRKPPNLETKGAEILPFRTPSRLNPLLTFERESKIIRDKRPEKTPVPSK